MKIRVLHLEDDAADADLVELWLRRAGVDSEIARVESRDAFIAALDEGCFDIIVSDLRLPGYDGLEALREVRRRRPEMAFVFFTGSVGEERAVDALKAGATDFVLKGGPDRLVPAMLRALREAEERIARRRAEGELRATQQRLSHVLSSSPAVLYSLRVEGDLLVPDWVSGNIEAVMGYTSEEVASPEWWMERLHPEDRESVLAKVPDLLVKGHVEREYRFRRPDGSYRWVRDEQKLLRGTPGRPAEVVGSWSDITERRQTELKLEQSEEQYRQLFDASPQPMWVYDLDTLAFLAVNDAAVLRYGWSRQEFLRMTIDDIRPPEEVPVVREAVAAGVRDQAPQAERVWTHCTKDGRRMMVEIAAGSMVVQGRRAALVLASDVTEKKKLEGQLLQSQKMEAVGQLAGGVAHDFNNLLNVITGFSELLAKDLGLDHPSLRRVEQIYKAADHAAGLTRQLLAFSRRQVLEPRVLDLNAAVNETEKMLRRLIGEHIQLITVFGEGLGRVRVDPGQVEQVILNLAVNARDAMPGGGRLIIESSNAELDEDYGRTHGGVAPGRYVMLAVSDTGHGMDPEVVSHIFEPFYTTKPEGKGTGLGLSTVYGIVKQSGGHVVVHSEVGRGTTFRIYLPRVDAKLEPIAAASEESLPSGTETILLVEDAEALRLMISEILGAAGYTVLPAANPEAALSAVEFHRGEIDLMLTDVVMPRINGRTLAERVKASAPDISVLYMSGYTDEAIGQQGILEPGTHFLQKPFTSAALLRKVRAAIDG